MSGEPPAGDGGDSGAQCHPGEDIGGGSELPSSTRVVATARHTVTATATATYRAVADANDPSRTSTTGRYRDVAPAACPDGKLKPAAWSTGWANIGRGLATAALSPKPTSNVTSRTPMTKTASTRRWVSQRSTKTSTAAMSTTTGEPSAVAARALRSGTCGGAPRVGEPTHRRAHRLTWARAARPSPRLALRSRSP